MAQQKMLVQHAKVLGSSLAPHQNTKKVKPINFTSCMFCLHLKKERKTQASKYAHYPRQEEESTYVSGFPSPIYYTWLLHLVVKIS